MGYAVLHLDKAQGADTAMTGHIGRVRIPGNAVPELTYLNEEFIEYPEGVSDRSEAIQHRIDNAGLDRKVGKNQVLAIRVMLSGTHEDMKRIEQEGKLDQWCADNLEWLNETYFKENVVSAVLHMDEKTPHIHATVVPIVYGERRKAREKKDEDMQGKKYRKKNPNRPRLCADDLMNRTKLKEYQDSYARKMSKYGLERGVEDSKARHVSTREYYRDLSIKKDKLENEVETVEAVLHDKHQQVSATEQNLVRLDKSIRKEELKSKTVDTAIKVVEKVGSLVYDSKGKEYQKQIAQLSESHQEKEEAVISLRTELENTHEDYRKQLGKKDAEIKEKDNEITVRAYVFPFHDVFARMLDFLYKIGIKGETLRKLFKFEPVRLSGKLYSHQYRRDYSAENSTARLNFHPAEKALDFLIDGKDHVKWFREKHRENMPEWEKKLEQKKEQSKGVKVG